jgi:hypothetical protein
LAVDSLVLQTAIGLIFVFAITAAAVSALTEGVSRFLGLRAEYLLRGVRTLVDENNNFKLPWPGFARPAKPEKPAWVAQIMNHPLIASSAKEAKPPPHAGNSQLTNAQRRRLPSYISGQTFAQALTDTLLRHQPRPGGTGPSAGSADAAVGSAGRRAEKPGPSAETADAAAETADAMAEAADAMAELRSWASKKASGRQPDPLATALRPMLMGAQDDMKAFEANVAKWYDDHMARVSGWYKRRVRWFSLAIGLVLVIAFNLNVIRIADALYSDQAVRGSVVTEATRASSCGDRQPAACLAELEAQIGVFRTAGLPVAWGDVPACATRTCSWLDRHGLASISSNGINDVWAFLLVLLGWVLMIAALIPGARFWFDLLSRLGSLRSTGPRPST